MVEHSIKYSMDHQAWSHVQQIGQQQTLQTTRLVNLAMIYRLIVNSQQIKQSQMLYVLGVLRNTASEDNDLDADQVYDSIIRNISPQPLWSAVIGHYNDVMDVSQFMIFLYFPLVVQHRFSFWVGSWVSVLIGVSGLAHSGSEFGFPG